MFLVIIGLINLVVLRRILDVFRRMRAGISTSSSSRTTWTTAAYEPVPRPGDQGRHQALAHVPDGLLFGLGFDTATEVCLLVLAGGLRRSPCPGTRS